MKRCWSAASKVSGCTIHFADNEYDHGPIILQRTVPVLDDDTPETLGRACLRAGVRGISRGDSAVRREAAEDRGTACTHSAQRWLALRFHFREQRGDGVVEPGAAETRVAKDAAGVDDKHGRDAFDAVTRLISPQALPAFTIGQVMC